MRATRWSQPFALAAALLGLALVGAFAWHVAAAPPTAAQDPAPVAPEPVLVPFDPERLDAVVAVRLHATRWTPWHQPWRPAVDHRVEQRDAEALARWRDTLRGVSRAGWTIDRTVVVDLILGDGTAMRGLGGGGALEVDGRAFLEVAPEIGALFEDFRTELRRLGRRAAGVARSLDELRELDPDRRAIVLPWLTADEARAELRRFRQLESIEFAPGASTSPLGENEVISRSSSPDLAFALASIATLRHVALFGEHLHVDALTALARLPQLRSLRIAHGLADVPAAELGEQARRLEALDVQSGLLSTAQLAALRGAKALRELRVRCGMQPDGLRDLLLTLPELRRLSIVGIGQSVAPITAAIVPTRVAELQLDALVLDPAALAQLAELPALHTLHLERVFVGDDCPDLSLLRGLRHLFPGSAPAAWRQQWAAALPECTVHAPDTAATSPFGVAPR